MSILTLKNDGLIDPLTITTMGVNVKGSATAIGYFGTGMKYAIAVLLRNKHKVTIYRGMEALRLSLRPTVIRGKEFELIYLNEQSLGITADLGKNWTVPMAFRELWSNMLDESGQEHSGKAMPDAHSTQIEVTGQEFYNAYLGRTGQFIDKSQIPLFKSPKLEIYEPQCDVQRTGLFYRGVFAHKLPYRAMFTYNVLTQQQLSEDRQMQHYWQADSEIGEAISNCTDVELIERIITKGENNKESFENERLSFNGALSPEFIKTALELGPRAIHSARWAARRAQGFSELDDCVAHIPSHIEQKIIDKASRFAKALGYDVGKYPVRYVEDLGSGVMAQAAAKQIWIAKAAFAGGTKFIVHSLIEEFIHLEFKVSDHTRELQNMLFDKIISLGEELQGEPL